MSKKTKSELVIFAIAAVIFLASQFLGIDTTSGGGGEVPESSYGSSLTLISGESQAEGNGGADAGVQTGGAQSTEIVKPGEGDGQTGGTVKPVGSGKPDSSVQQGEAGSSDNGTLSSGSQSGVQETTEGDIKQSSASGKERETKAGSTDQTASAPWQPESTRPEELKSELSGKAAESTIAEDGSYTDKDSVALYIHTYGRLPHNFITKSEAMDEGWDSRLGNLDDVAPGMSIGGDKFGNYEGRLPKKKNRKYYECDINYDPDEGYRGGERIIYSNDGLVYYTGDHYNTFELLYGKP